MRALDQLAVGVDQQDPGAVLVGNGGALEVETSEITVSQLERSCKSIKRRLGVQQLAIDFTGEGASDTEILRVVSLAFRRPKDEERGELARIALSGCE